MVIDRSMVDYPDTYLPPFCALPRELGEYDLLLRVFLLVLFPAGLYEKGIRCHAPPRFIVLDGPVVYFALDCIVLHLHVCLILFWERGRERKKLVRTRNRMIDWQEVF